MYSAYKLNGPEELESLVGICIDIIVWILLDSYSMEFFGTKAKCMSSAALLRMIAALMLSARRGLADRLSIAYYNALPDDLSPSSALLLFFLQFIKDPLNQLCFALILFAPIFTWACSTIFNWIGLHIWAVIL